MSLRSRTVVYDHQTFTLQAYGGISRYFCELAERVNAVDDFRASIVAPLHFNSHLAQSSVPRSGFHVDAQGPRTQRLCRAANRLLAPALTWAQSPSLIHRTFFKPLGRHRNLPLVLTVFDMIHELFPEQFDANDPVARNKRRSIDQADHILCISKSTARDLMRLFDIPADKISVTYLGYSSVFEATPGLPVDPPSDRPYLLYVGHRAGYKNFEGVLRAFAASARLLDSLDLVLFGGPALNDEERSLISKLGIPSERVVQRFGSDLQLAAAYRQARAFVYPSQYEGFGIPPIEAMASSCPVACSNTSSIPEVAGTAARLFNPSDVDDMRQAIEEVCFDENLRCQLQVAGRQRAGQFSWERCADETIAAYRKVLSGSTA